MADNFSQVIQLAFQVLGADDAQRVADTLQGVGTAGGEANAKLSPLIDAFESLAQQAQLVDKAIDLRDRLAENSASLEQAKAALADLNAEFSKSDKSSADVTLAFSQAQKQVTSLAAEQLKLQNATASTSAQLKAAGIDATNLSAAHDKLRTQAQAAAGQIASVAAASSAASAAAKGEAVSIESLSEKYTTFGRIVEGVKDILATISAFYTVDKAAEGIEEVVKEGDKLAGFAIQLQNAFGSLKAGQEAFAKINEIAEKTPLAVDDITRSVLRAKKDGLDPFNGTIETLIDVNAKYGGTVDTLNTLIDAFGKATARGSLTTRELVSLQQQGVPAAKLLADALGKTTTEIEEMAEQGEIGRESIKLLIDQLGQSAKGAAAAQLNLASSLVTKIHDKFEDFLGLIAKSGAYDYVIGKLSQINDAFAKGLGDGTLKEKAQSLSNAIVAIGDAVSRSVGFIKDHATAILAAAHAWSVFKLSMLSLDLAGVATRFVGLSGAVKEATAAAEVAGAEGGVFARLGAKISAIPKAIQIGITIAAADFAVTQIEKVLAASKQLQDLNRQDNQLQKDTNALRDELVVKAGVVATALKGYADAQIASADVLAAKDRVRSEEYIASLQNATRYYEALRIQAEANADYKGVELNTAQIKSLGLALVAANAHYKEVTESLSHLSDTVGVATEHFDDLKRTGSAAASAVEGSFNKIEINTPQGLKDTIDIVRSIASRSAEAGSAIQTELIGALSKLNAADLARFQNNVTERLDQAKGRADDLRIALGASLQAALLKLGLSAQQVGAQFSQAGQDAIYSFNLIAKNAEATGEQIQLAFSKALSKASTQGEVEALEKLLQDAFKSGSIGADQFGVAMEAAGRKVAAIATEAITASASLDGVGKAGQNAAERISGALQDARDKLVVQANKIAAALTDALTSGASPEVVAALRASFKVVDTELATLNTQIASVGVSLETVFKGDHGGGVNITKNFQDTAAAAKKTAEELFTVDNLAGKSASQIDDMGKAAGKTSVEINSTKDAIEGVVDGTHDAVAGLSSALESARASLAAISDAAGKAFDAQIVRTWADAVAGATGTGIKEGYQAIADAANHVTREIQAQRSELAGQIAQYDTFAAAGTESFDSTNAAAQISLLTIQRTAAALKDGTYAAGLLGSQDLAGLQTALDGAISRANALANAEKQAVAQLVDLNSQLQDQIDQDNNNQVAIENRRFAKQEQDIKDLAEQSGAAGEAQAQQALQLAQKVHDDALAKIKQQADASTQAAAQTQAAQHQANNASNSSSASSTSQVTAVVRLEVVNAGDSLTNLTQQQLNTFADQLTPLVAPRFMDLINRANGVSNFRN